MKNIFKKKPDKHYLHYEVDKLHKKLLKYNLKALKLYLDCMYKIGIPKNEKENELLKRAVCSCKEIIKDINEEIDRYIY